ncbi:FAD-dependent monooxygenase [Spongiactinospora sp. TRM90649]|uniref:FAD-dependent monooxygenase n=1 Tax=Spongiactinospora sp. TRM90649 TaxID=3031114 RepID=UPI0023F9DBF1|nr:FAD-dependent monooxygenase [Spongiactinospora sp. TRM90649]MDF5752438.1 FAD-dependent monooxygenase [Spongiactinospora sp. TRM90649]
MRNPLPVLVVGAGPTGLALATELRRQGVECRIIDQSGGRPADQARALTLWPGALDVLSRQGTAAAVIAAGARMSAARYWSKGKNVATVRLPEEWNGVPTMLGITQPVVEGIMSRRLAELGVDVGWHTRLESVADHGDRVTARLSGPGGDEEFAASWVVGCDGAHSSVRELAGIPFGGRTYSRSFVLGDGDVDSPVPLGEAHYHLHPDGVLVLVSLPGGGLRVFADATTVGSHDTAPTMEELQRLADERAPYPVRIRALGWSTRFLVHMRQAARYRSGRLLLAGDAAHVHSPAGGQGLNTGIQDAANLAWKLALIQAGSAHTERLLDSYQAERSPVAAEVLRGAHTQTRLWTMRSQVSRLLRDTLLGVLDRAGALERRFVPPLTQDDLDYRRSPAVGPRGGRRALGPRGMPDAEVVPASGGPPVRLRRLLSGPKHTLLVLPGPGDATRVAGVLSDVAPLSDRLRTHVLLPADGGHSADRYPEDAHVLPAGWAPGGRLAGCTLVLVRPDGYVADAATTFEAGPLVDLLRPAARRAGEIPADTRAES